MSSQLLSSLLGGLSLFQHIKANLLQHGTLTSPSTLLFLPVLLVPVVNTIWRHIRQDYGQFLSLGPGGTPSTPLGYLKVTTLRFLIARKDVYQPPNQDSNCLRRGPYFQSPHDLPTRKMKRPDVAGIAPQRQLTQCSNRQQNEALRRYMSALAEKNSSILSTGKSCFEKNSLGLFLKPQDDHHEINHDFSDIGRSQSPYKLQQTQQSQQTEGKGIFNHTCGAPPEVAHMHGKDGSLHLTLHPEDVGTVIEHGWGERHPLAGTGGMIKDIFNGRSFQALYEREPSEGWLPQGFIMVYAPKNEEEREIVGKIIKAAAWWVGGAKLREEAEL